MGRCAWRGVGGPCMRGPQVPRGGGVQGLDPSRLGPSTVEGSAEDTDRRGPTGTRRRHSERPPRWFLRGRGRCAREARGRRRQGSPTCLGEHDSHRTPRPRGGAGARGTAAHRVPAVLFKENTGKAQARRGDLVLDGDVRPRSADVRRIRACSLLRPFDHVAQLRRQSRGAQPRPPLPRPQVPGHHPTPDL